MEHVCLSDGLDIYTSHTDKCTCVFNVLAFYTTNMSMCICVGTQTCCQAGTRVGLFLFFNCFPFPPEANTFVSSISSHIEQQLLQ